MPAELTERLQEDEETTTDPLSKTIVIHPGSKWLRIGRASDAFPLAVPYIIARKQRNFVPSSRDKGKQREEPHSAPAPAPAPAPPPQSSFASFGQLPPLPGADEDTDMLDDDDDDDRGPAVDPAAPVDPLSAKISSIRGDLRARMRAFKLRGQGNGNSQAMAFNATVTPDATADYNDPGEIEWTKTEGEEAQEVYVGAEVRFLMARDRSRGSTDATHYYHRPSGYQTPKPRATSFGGLTIAEDSTPRATPLSRSCWAISRRFGSLLWRRSLASERQSSR